MFCASVKGGFALCAVVDSQQRRVPIKDFGVAVSVIIFAVRVVLLFKVILGFGYRFAVFSGIARLNRHASDNESKGCRLAAHCALFGIESDNASAEHGRADNLINAFERRRAVEIRRAVKPVQHESGL